jgi:DNA-binding transcriptional regulator GbsR (MarR family)
MTEMTDVRVELPRAIERFVLQWGDLGGQWGVNRTVGQIHALLYLSGRPLAADEISDRLGVARSNVSNSLKELLGWKLIRRVPVLGDRRDFFEAENDLWEILLRIVEGRKEREIDPAITALRDCAADANSDSKIDPTAAKRLQEMLAFVESLNRWYEQVRELPKEKLATLVKLGGRIANIITFGKRKARPRE